MIFAASTFISIFKQANIGNVVTVALTNILAKSSFSGLPLLILLFTLSMIATLFLPNSLPKWTIMATAAVPALMNTGVSPEFSQVAFRLGEAVSLGLTPVFAYFIVYLAYLEKYSQDNKNISIFKAIKLQLRISLRIFPVHWSVL